MPEGSVNISENQSPTGIPLFLSQIKEWVVDCGFDTVVITIRTEASWYKLETPHRAYKPWFNVVLKCARLAVKIISMIMQEVSCFCNIIEILMELKKFQMCKHNFVSSLRAI